jgi:hypothetical protein
MCEAGALYGVLVAERNALRQQLAAAETARARLAAVARAAEFLNCAPGSVGYLIAAEQTLRALRALEPGDLADARPAAGACSP